MTVGPHEEHCSLIASPYPVAREFQSPESPGRGTIGYCRAA